MGIKVVPKSTMHCHDDEDLELREGFCHDIEIAIKKDGSVSPASFRLGNHGDRSVTRLVFDTKRLRPYGWSIDNYSPKLAVYDITTGEELDEPWEITKEGFLCYFVIPNAWTATMHDYKIIFAMVETSGNGNVDEGEVFVSNEFIAEHAQETLIDYISETHLINATVTTDADIDLKKPELIIRPKGSYYNMIINSNYGGNKYDQYMKRITLDNRYCIELNEGLTHRYMIFRRKGSNNEVYVYKMLSFRAGFYDTCWIPPEVTEHPGKYDIGVVAQNEEPTMNAYTADFKRWVSNLLEIEVIDNFLTKGFDPTPTPVGMLYWATLDNIPEEIDEEHFTVESIPTTILINGVIHFYTTQGKQYECFAYPKKYGDILHIYENDMTMFDLIDSFERIETTYNKIDYYLYYTVDAAKETDAKYQFLFK